MKKILPLLLSAASLVAFSSCIRDEALNAECDITGVDADWLEEHKSVLIGNPIVSNEAVTFTIKRGTTRTAFNPKFDLTEGAWLTMRLGDGQLIDANGQMRDFTTPQIYTAHSQDGQWTKDYTVSFYYTSLLRLLSFEHFSLESNGKYYEWYEVDDEDTDNPRRNYWATGNGGYNLTGMAQSPSDFPTAPDVSGVRGNCVKLVTRDTGSFGMSLATKMPIAAGNLFIGEFRVGQAALFPLQATRFGLQLVNRRPVSLEGYYKYQAGPVYTDENKNVCPELHDSADIYAVVYEVDADDFKPLNGADVLTSERIVALARIDKPVEVSGDIARASWTQFSEPFVLLNGKEFDEERIGTNGYAIAVVATSSRQGNYFKGAVGSTLYIDELRVRWEGETDDDSGVTQ